MYENFFEMRNTPFVRNVPTDRLYRSAEIDDAIDSPVLGVIAPANLSGGVKTLILIDKIPEMVFNASNCGDNCAAWLLKIGSKQDVTVNHRKIISE